MTESRITESRRPVIAVMPKYVTADRLSKSVSSCDSLLIADNYMRAVVAAGGIPVIVPLADNDELYREFFSLVDGFLLTGGVDLDPRLYGGDVDNETLSSPVPVREKVEFRVLDYAFEHDVPLLGICRGIQLLNVYKGGSLYENLADYLPEVDDEGQQVKHWQDIEYAKPSHRVKLVEGSLLGELLQTDTVTVNSMHHQGVRELGEGLEPMAFGPGGLVEALRAPELAFAVGLQWHPEYLGEHGGLNRIFERLVSEAAAYHQRRNA